MAALFSCTMTTLIGRWAFVPTWGLFIALGNAASGGAVAPPLLPPFYDFVGRFLPNGATVGILRNAVYFTSDQHIEPIVVMLSWLVVLLVCFLVAARVRSHPGDRLTAGWPTGHRRVRSRPPGSRARARARTGAG